MEISPKLDMPWEAWDLSVLHLAKNIVAVADQWQPKRLIGITRGGVIAAVQLSHLLDIPYTHTIHASVYDKRTELGIDPKLVLNSPPSFTKEEQRTSLFIDDMLDDGFTIRSLSGIYPWARFAVPVARLAGYEKIDQRLMWAHPGTLVKHSLWITFPWEKSYAK